MKAPWDYLENLNKSVYVVDCRDGTLVYLNRYAREQLQRPDDESYVGQKWETVLQDLPGACGTCADLDLAEGQFHEWVYHNKLLGTSYLLTGTVVEHQGSSTGSRLPRRWMGRRTIPCDTLRR